MKGKESVNRNHWKFFAKYPLYSFKLLYLEKTFAFLKIIVQNIIYAIFFWMVDEIHTVDRIFIIFIIFFSFKKDAIKQIKIKEIK